MPRPPLWLALLVVGCTASAPAVTARRVRMARAPSGDGCPATETRLGGQCWSALGTRWQVEAEGPGGTYRFDAELLAANRLRTNDHAAAGPASDEWVQDGPLLRLFLSDRFVEYRGRLTNGTVLLGEARNVRGQRWAFAARRAFGETGCAVGEARVGDACMSVAGTRWRLDAEGLDRATIAFMSAGELHAQGHEQPVGSWTQDRTALRFELSGGEVFEAQVGDDVDTLTGHWRSDDRERAWRATRLESFPPVMHP